MERFDLLLNNFEALNKELKIVSAQLKKENKEFFNAIVENSTNFISIVQDGQYVFVNTYGLNLLRCKSSADVIGRNIIDFIQSEYKDIAIRHFSKTDSKGNPIHIKFVRTDDTVFDTEINSAPFYYNKKPAVLIIGRDITSELDQKEIIQKEQQLRTDILNSFKEVIAFYEPNHRVRWLNKAGKEQLGITDNSYIGKYCYNIWFGNNRPCTECPVVTRNIKPSERIVTFSDESIWMVRHIPMFDDSNKLTGFVEFRENVTDKEKTKQELEKSRVRQIKAELTASLGHYEYDLIKKTKIWSHGAYQIIGLPYNQSQSDEQEDFTKYIHPDDIERVMYHLNRTFTEYSKFDQVYRIKDIHGNIKIIHELGEVIIDAEKKSKIFFGTVQDMTQIHALKKQLTNEENRYKTLAENSPVGVCIARGHRIIYTNKMLLTIAGYNSEKDLIKSNALDLIHPNDRKVVTDVVKKINNQEANYPIRLRIRNIRKDGSFGILDLFITECIIFDQIYTQAIIIDMTKEIEIEKKNKQLAADLLYINQKNKILHEIETELNKVLNSKKTFLKRDFQNITNIIGSYSKLDKDWDLLKSHFEEIHSSFFDKLEKAHPTLTTNDLKHCACIKLNFSTKEIARFFNIRAASVQIARVRLKKKMNLLESTDLRNYILTF